MSGAPDMSVLCEDWTPTVDQPVIECQMPPGQAVEITLEVDRYQPMALPVMLLHAAQRTVAASMVGLPWEEVSALWDLTVDPARQLVRIDPEPNRHHYFRRRLRTVRVAFASNKESFRVTLTYRPSMASLSVTDYGAVGCARAVSSPWTLSIGCPKEFDGMLPPLGSLITCRWRILPEGGAT